jgi:hypothetical protein
MTIRTSGHFFALACTVSIQPGCVTSRVVDPRLARIGETRVGVEVLDPAGGKEDAFLLPPRQDGAATLPVLGAPADPRGATDEEEESPYARFGSNIVVHKDKRITKFYYVTRETGAVLLGMLAKPGAEPPKPGDPYGVPSYYTSIGGEGTKPEQLKGILSRLLEDHTIEIELIGNWDRVASLDMAASFTGKYGPPAPGAPPGAPPDTGGPVNDLLMVTAQADGLEKFEHTLNLFYAQVPQVEIEARVVEFTYGESLDLGVSPIDATTPTIGTRNPRSFLKGITSLFPNASATEGLLTLGGVHDNIAINAVLELLQTKVKSDILSNPRIAVRNSGMAQIETTSQVPFPEARIIGTNVQTNIAFKTVGVKLHIRPVIAGTETVILNIFAEVSAVTSFQSSDPSEELSVPIPIISTRTANTSVHVPNKKTIIIGGLLTKSMFENESKVPVLGDIPLLGYLFRSTSYQASTNEVVFFITPRIIHGFRGEHVDAPVLR